MKNIFCDLDGVLVDLLEGYRQVAGDCLTNLHGVGDVKWEPALEHPDFWATLPKMDDADVLLNHLQELYNHERLYVLTAPQHLFENCEDEKIRWVKNHAPFIENDKIIVIDRHRKQEFAVCDETGAPNVLIDDYEKNIIEWIEAGGIGIHHQCAPTTIRKLMTLQNDTQLMKLGLRL